MSKDMNKKRGSYHDAVILLAAVIIGGAAGLIFGEKATIVKPIGTIFINLMFCILVPLVFFSIASSVATFDNMKKLGKILSSVFLVFVCTGTIASLIMIILVQILPYAQAEGFDINSVTAEAAKATPIGDHIVNMFTVPDFPNLISKSHILPLIVFSIFFGVSVSMVEDKGKAIVEGMLNLADVMYKMIGILMKFAPLGLGAYFADLTGTYGPKLLGTYFQGVVLFYPTLLIYFLIAYTVCTYMAGGVQGVKTYYKNILAPALTAFGTRSSAASIPGQIEACNNIGVPKDVSSVVIPFGATCHMDGSAMSSIFRL